MEKRFPRFGAGCRECLFEADAGFVLVEESIIAHCRLAQTLGAELRFDEPLLSWAMDGAGVVVTTANDSYAADRLIIAAGAWASTLLAEIDLPLTVERIPQACFRAAPQAGSQPCFIFDLEAGQFFGTPLANRGMVKVGGRNRRARVADPMHASHALTPDERTELGAFVETHLRDVSPTPAKEAACMCTMTPDDNFIVDAHPDCERVVFAAGMSGHGYKFAPVLGEALADLAIDGRTAQPIDFLRRRAPKTNLALALLAGTLVATGCHSHAKCSDAHIATCIGKQMVCLADGSPPKCDTCPQGTYPTKTGTCESLGAPVMMHEFQQWTIPAGAEYKGQCQSWTLNNPNEMWINAVELAQNEFSHHSIWTFVPDDHFVGPDGTWTCTDRNYDDVKGALFGGVLYAQSTQATHEVQKFPAGAAIRIPPYCRIISDIHLLNATQQDQTGSLKLWLYAIPPEQVTAKLVPFQLDDRAVTVLPNAQTRLANDCSGIDNAFRAIGAKFDYKIHYLLPHTHGYGTRFLVQTAGGTRDGETVFDLHETGFEAHGLAFDPPFDVTGALGLRFSCEYANDTANTLHWGWSEEMCMMLGYAQTTVAFDAGVLNATQGASDGSMNVFNSDKCTITAAPWDFNKPGGPPR
jgi:hypothetical protein